MRAQREGMHTRSTLLLSFHVSIPFYSPILHLHTHRCTSPLLTCGLASGSHKTVRGIASHVSSWHPSSLLAWCVASLLPSFALIPHRTISSTLLRVLMCVLICVLLCLFTDAGARRPRILPHSAFLLLGHQGGQARLIWCAEYQLCIFLILTTD